MVTMNIDTVGPRRIAVSIDTAKAATASTGYSHETPTHSSVPDSTFG